ncbi:PKD domain-containing protein [Acidipila rosea]|uniref:PKD domain-containing protein n=1 Tax=Acidipila rosea TaxID=768535 RepID=A0A4R1L7G0_9BACT|nr:PKD domain-containing protein [Acidipila rosea]TCK74156.1 hypothetical protein C7378_1778 [Acidipila rosea]
MRKLNACLLFFLALFAAAAPAQTAIYPTPPAVRSSRFRVTVNGHRTWFIHAAANYYFLNFAAADSTKIVITAPDANYWQRGVEIAPWSLGLRAQRRGRTISFTLHGPAKLSISRPGDHFAGAEMLFLFANPPEAKPPLATDPDTLFFKPGTYRQSITPHSGQNVYLAPGAVIYGALNLWQVENVHVYGRGVLIYDGPQNPLDDQGWMHKPDWHGILLDHARNVEIDGITVVVRSRTWMIQMWNSHHVGFNNVKVIGGSTSDANQDGMDWRGGGDTSVRNSFIRAADDVFAIEGDNDFYSGVTHTTPGDDVNNITIENDVVSTSVSNIVRVSWPLQHFNSHNFLMRNVDVLHMGYGSCKVPFALFELWSDQGGWGSHSNYRLQNIRLEDWYSLLQIDQKWPAVRDIKLEDIWALGSPSMAPSTLSGDVQDVTLSNVEIAGQPITSRAALPLRIEAGAQPPAYSMSANDAAMADPPDSSPQFTYTPGLLRPHQAVTFRAAPHGDGTIYHWLFGDGSQATGPVVQHRFPDARGTLLDNSGSFRVLLHVIDAKGRESWAAHPVIVGGTALPALDAGNLEVPADGGYTFTLMTAGQAELKVDGRTITHSPAPKPLVCGTPGYAVQPASGSLQLRRGLHRIEISGASGSALYWEGPALPMQKVAAAALP